jgi:KaiC/GvpD/RAD55 family RecA-like ATPase
MDPKRISTGIAGLDPLLDGGYIKGRIFLLCGEAGTGKTIACLQFLTQALRLGERAVYVTVDERPAEILESAESFEWDLQRHIQEKSLVILDASPYFGGRGSGGEKGVDPHKIAADLGNYAKRLAATILIVDPLTPLISPGEASGLAQEQARSLMQLIQSQLVVTTLFTAHCSEGSTAGLTHGVEQFLASGVLIFKTTSAKGKLERTVLVKKMRATAVEPAEHRFVIRKREGIVLADLPADVVATIPMFELFEPKKNLSEP